jgi:hypothetical protein
VGLILLWVRLISSSILRQLALRSISGRGKDLLLDFFGDVHHLDGLNDAGRVDVESQIFGAELKFS